MRVSFKKFLLFAGLAMLLFLGWFGWRLFGPNPPIVVSKETTYITEPLRADCLPDYEKYVLEKYREGVTPENNSAVLFWQAMGPGEMDLREFAVVADEIGLETIPLPEEFLEHVHGDENRAGVRIWLERNGIARPVGDNDDNQAQEAVEQLNSAEVIDKLLDQATKRPWTSEQIPPLADWVVANEKPLNLLLAASERARFYPASPTLLNNTHDLLLVMHLPGAQSARDATRALCARAMWQLGEGRNGHAWNDILAIYHWSRLVGQGTTLVELMVSFAIDEIANRATMNILDDPDVTPDLAKRIGKDLQSLSPSVSIGEVLDKFERTAILSALLSIRDGNGHDWGDHGLDAIFLMAVDWNIPLRKLNGHYDELSAAAKLASWAARKKALDEHEERLKQIEQEVKLHRAVGGLGAWKLRSEIVGDIFVTHMLPATSAACQAEDRANTQLALTRLAAAIAIYRAEHGEYLESLEALVPGVLDKLPVDLFHDNPFVYRRTNNGYLLYSRGPNGQDDGGSNQLMQNFKGYSADLQSTAQLHELLGDDLPMVEDENAAPSDDSVMRPLSEDNSLLDHIPQDADDIAIRLPLPKLELPKAK